MEHSLEHFEELLRALEQLDAPEDEEDEDENAVAEGEQLPPPAPEMTRLRGGGPPWALEQREVVEVPPSESPAAQPRTAGVGVLCVGALTLEPRDEAPPPAGPNAEPCDWWGVWQAKGPHFMLALRPSLSVLELVRYLRGRGVPVDELALRHYRQGGLGGLLSDHITLLEVRDELLPRQFACRIVLAQRVIIPLAEAPRLHHTLGLLGALSVMLKMISEARASRGDHAVRDRLRQELAPHEETTACAVTLLAGLEVASVWAGRALAWPDPAAPEQEPPHDLALLPSGLDLLSEMLAQILQAIPPDALQLKESHWVEGLIVAHVVIEHAREHYAEMLRAVEQLDAPDEEEAGEVNAVVTGLPPPAPV